QTPLLRLDLTMQMRIHHSPIPNKYLQFLSAIAWLQRVNAPPYASLWVRLIAKRCYKLVIGECGSRSMASTSLFRIAFFQELLYSSIFRESKGGLMNKLIVPAVIVAFGMIAAAALSQQAQPPASG